MEIFVSSMRERIRNGALFLCDFVSYLCLVRVLSDYTNRMKSRLFGQDTDCGK